MSKLTDDRLREIVAGCEGVTPGLWETDTTRSDGSYGTGDDTHQGFDAYQLIGPPQYPGGRDIIICDTLNSDAGSIEEDWDEESHSAWDEQGRKNMAHIARLDPDTVKAICTELLALRAAASTSTEGAGVKENDLHDFIWAGDWEQPMMPPEIAGRSPEYVWGYSQSQTLHDLIEALKVRSLTPPAPKVTTDEAERNVEP